MAGEVIALPAKRASANPPPFKIPLANLGPAPRSRGCRPGSRKRRDPCPCAGCFCQPCHRRTKLSAKDETVRSANVDLLTCYAAVTMRRVQLRVEDAAHVGVEVGMLLQHCYHLAEVRLAQVAHDDVHRWIAAATAANSCGLPFGVGCGGGAASVSSAACRGAAGWRGWRGWRGSAG